MNSRIVKNCFSSQPGRCTRFLFGGLAVGVMLVVWTNARPVGRSSAVAADDSRPHASTPATQAPSSPKPGNRQEITSSPRPSQAGYRRQTFQFKNKADESQSRQLDLWYPTLEKEEKHDYKHQTGFIAEGAKVAPGKHPLLLFSHGFLGGSDQTIFLTEACARAGYIVASMNHTDALFNRRQRRIEPPKFADAANWTDDKFRDRQEDLSMLLNQFLKWNQEEDSPWEGHIDGERIGGIGHSLGGYTLLGMAGGWKSWKEPRLKAVVLLSPYAQPYGPNGDLPHVKVPVMLQGGSFDIGITPFLPPIYEKLAGPKVFLVLKAENHFGWTNLASLNSTTKDIIKSGNPELMVQYTIAFLDHFLLESDQSKLLESQNKRLDSYRFEGFEPRKQD